MIPPVTGVAATTPAAALNVLSPAARSTNSGSPTDPAQLAKLRKAAGEFEAMLLESLWKSMKETFADPDEENDPTLKSFDEFGMQAMASAVGNSGGLGIKNMILKYLEPAIPGGGPDTARHS